MIGFDFQNFWNVGRMVLSGQDPYSIVLSYYPPAATYFFAILACIPFPISFGLWTGTNFVMLLHLLRRLKQGWRAYTWLGFAPVPFILLTGQLDLFFFWFASFLTAGGWKAALCGAIVTLKPQVAFIVLPWYILQWVIHDRKQLLRWGGFTALLYGFPLLLDVHSYLKWYASIHNESGWRLLASPGVFALTNLGIPLGIIILIALVVIIIGLRKDSITSWAAQILALPMGLWYEDILLLGSVPWWLVVPGSWVAFYLALIWHTNIPFVYIPVAVFCWRVWAKSKAPPILNGKQ
jgi:hypothetical protein